MPERFSKKQLLSALLAIVIVFTVVIDVCYIWLLPTIFNGYKTYSVLIMALLGSYFSAGYFGFRLRGVTSVGKRAVISICSGFAVASLVLYASMLIIVNVVGS